MRDTLEAIIKKKRKETKLKFGLMQTSFSGGRCCFTEKNDIDLFFNVSTANDTVSLFLETFAVISFSLSVQSHIQFLNLRSKQKHYPAQKHPRVMTVLSAYIQIRSLSAFPSNCIGFDFAMWSWKISVEKFCAVWKEDDWSINTWPLCAVLFLKTVWVLFLFHFKLREVADFIYCQNRNTWSSYRVFLTLHAAEQN